MDLLGIGLTVVGACASAWGTLRFITTRRQVLAPGEVPLSSGLPVMLAGDLALTAGVLLLVM